MRDKIIEVIKGIDADADITAMLAAPGTRLADTIGFDSLDYMSLCLDLEKQFDIEVDEDEWVELASLESIEVLVARKV